MSKITHEQAREILNKIYYHCKDIPRQEDLEQYFLQQEKQEKLLELYREALKTNTTLTYYKSFTTNKEKIKEYESKVFIINEQIKELENDNYNK